MKKIRLEVMNISSSQAQTPAYAMLLQEVGGERRLPIIIGPAEAQSITFKINSIQSIRPLTHDLFANVLTNFDIQLIEVLIYKAEEGIFFSYIFLQKGDNTIQIDARTSDAVAMAVRFDVPIYILEPVLDKECILIENTEDLTPESEKTPTDAFGSKSIDILKKELAKAVKNEDYEKASVLRDEIARRNQ